MPDTKTSLFTDGVAALGTDRLPAARAGANVYLTLDYAGTYFAKNTLAAGTLTDPAPMTLTQTWNDAADTFTALKLNVTNTNSSASSMLQDWQVGGTSVLKLLTNGHIIAPADLVINAGAGGDFFRAAIGNIGCTIQNATNFGWGDASNQVTRIGRMADHHIRFGGSVESSTANAQTISVHSVIAGTSNT